MPRQNHRDRNGAVSVISGQVPICEMLDDVREPALRNLSKYSVATRQFGLALQALVLVFFTSRIVEKSLELLLNLGMLVGQIVRFARVGI